ncbi:MAG: acyltransferase family protein, partial [Ilumatobacteraceae bacterium]
LAGRSYEELFASVSPMLHLWSLSIEAQLYLLLPLVIMVAAVMGGRRRGIGFILGFGFVVSTIISILTTSSDRLYYGTDTRAAELLAGALLACAWRPSVDRAADDWWRTVGRWIPVVALVGVVTTARVSTTGSPWVYSGALSLFALASMVLVVGAIQPGPLRRVLQWRPLVRIGLVSYGLYLYHWSIFVWMSPERTGLEGEILFVARLMVTGLVTMVSYLIVETPIRRRRILIAPGSVRAATIGAIAIGVIVPSTWLHAVDTAVETNRQVLATVPPNDDTVDALRILVIGDSTSENLARAFADAGDPLLGVVSAGVIGCPLVSTAEVFDRPGTTRDSTYCPDTVQSIRDSVAEVDAVVVVAGVANQWDYRALDGTVVKVGSEDYRNRLRNWIEGVHEALAMTGVPMVIFEAPMTRSSDIVLGDEPEAVAAWNAMIEEFDETWVSVGRLAYSDLLSDPESVAGRAERPDGVHLEREFAARLASTELVPRLREIHRSLLQQMDAVGCRRVIDDRATLEVARCRANGPVVTSP